MTNTNYNKIFWYATIYISIVSTLLFLFTSSLYKKNDHYLLLFFILILITPILGAIYKNNEIPDGYAYGFLSITLPLVLTYFYCQRKYTGEDLKDFEIYTYLLLPASFGYNLSKISLSLPKKCICDYYHPDQNCNRLEITSLLIAGLLIFILSIFSFILIDKNATSIIAGTFLAMILTNTLNKLDTFEPK